METCSPVSQAGPRDTSDLEGWLPEQQWEPTRVHTWYKTVFQPLRCATWAWRGALTQKKQKRACGPHQPQPAHQVAKVDVVQILQPSTMDTVPALLTVGPHGNVRPKAGPCSHARYLYP